MADNDETKNNQTDKPGHTLADHSLGIDLAHTHDGYADHDHDFPDELPLEENPIWIADHVSLETVGIDIGSSGTQVIFSRVNLRRLGEELTSRYYVVSRETLFQSPIALTPYASEERIDEAALGKILDDAYAAARIGPDEIDTGVVILTGEALRRENAQAIAALIAEKGGDFVCATAGHHMESMLAAYGSGAARVSSDEGKRILNIDIGGGTTKLGLVENGKVTRDRRRARRRPPAGGGRRAARIVRLDPAGKHHAKRAGFAWNRGDRVTEADMDKVADAMADALVAAITARPMPHDVAHLYLTDPIADLGRIDGIMFSGGVGRIRLRPRDPRLRRHGPAARPGGARPRRCGRLSVAVPAGARVHPRHRARRLRVQRAALRQHQLHLGARRAAAAPQPAGPAAALRLRRDDRSRRGRAGDPQPHRRVRRRGRARDRARVPLAGRARLRAARRVRRGHPARARATRIARGQALYIMLDGDVAQTLGHILRDEMEVKSELLVIDGVVLWDFDYIDLGRIRMPSNTVPVTIKSLVFNEDPRGPRPRQRLHHHDARS